MSTIGKYSQNIRLYFFLKPRKTEALPSVLLMAFPLIILRESEAFCLLAFEPVEDLAD